jgi:hypothetical protein
LSVLGVVFHLVPPQKAQQKAQDLLACMLSPPNKCRSAGLRVDLVQPYCLYARRN